jgi:hypothetical protein
MFLQLPAVQLFKNLDMFLPVSRMTMIIDVMSAVMMTGMRMIVADVKEDSTGDHWGREREKV